MYNLALTARNLSPPKYTIPLILCKVFDYFLYSVFWNFTYIHYTYRKDAKIIRSLARNNKVITKHIFKVSKMSSSIRLFQIEKFFEMEDKRNSILMGHRMDWKWSNIHRSVKKQFIFLSIYFLNLGIKQSPTINKLVVHNDNLVKFDV